MKNKKRNKNKSGTFTLFLTICGILFAGLSLCNICAIAIDCVFNGFGSFLSRIGSLPYLFYLILSLILSMVLTFIIHKKTKR